MCVCCSDIKYVINKDGCIVFHETFVSMKLFYAAYLSHMYAYSHIRLFYGHLYRSNR